MKSGVGRALRRPYRVRTLVGLSLVLVIVFSALAARYAPAVLWWSTFRWTAAKSAMIPVQDGPAVWLEADSWPGFFSPDCQGGARYTYLRWSDGDAARVYLVSRTCTCTAGWLQLRGDAPADRVWAVAGSGDGSGKEVIATLDRRTGEFTSLLGLPQGHSTRWEERRKTQSTDLYCGNVDLPVQPRPRLRPPPAWATIDGGRLLLDASGWP